MPAETTPSPYAFDFLAIGAGSGGIAAVNRAARHGAKCAIVESGRLGGTCVNRGCVPKKVMWNAAALAHDLDYAADYGITFGPSEFHWPTLKQARDAYILKLHGNYQTVLEDNRVTLIRGSAQFVRTHRGSRRRAVHGAACFDCQRRQAVGAGHSGRGAGDYLRWFF